MAYGRAARLFAFDASRPLVLQRTKGSVVTCAGCRFMLVAGRDSRAFRRARLSLSARHAFSNEAHRNRSLAARFESVRLRGQGQGFWQRPRHGRWPHVERRRRAIARRRRWRRAIRRGRSGRTLRRGRWRGRDGWRCGRSRRGRKCWAQPRARVQNADGLSNSDVQLLVRVLCGWRMRPDTAWGTQRLPGWRVRRHGPLPRIQL
jgi:hypothetical protein